MVTDEIYDEDECMRRTIGTVEDVLLQTNSPSSARLDCVNRNANCGCTSNLWNVGILLISYVSIKEPTKKRIAARKLYGKGKKCKVDCCGGSYKFSETCGCCQVNE